MLHAMNAEADNVCFFPHFVQFAVTNPPCILRTSNVLALWHLDTGPMIRKGKSRQPSTVSAVNVCNRSRSSDILIPQSRTQPARDRGADSIQRAPRDWRTARSV